MFSVRLSDIPRTTSFRVALLFMLLFGTTSLALFGYIYWRTSSYLSVHIDHTLERKVYNYSRMTPHDMLAEATEHTGHDAAGLAPVGLFDATGHWRLGGLQQKPYIPAWDVPFNFSRTGNDGSLQHLRGVAHVLADGNVLVMAADVRDISEFGQAILGALESGGVIMLILGLLGATAMGLSTQRRLQGVTSAIQRIVKGDLSKRLPVRGVTDDVDQLAVVVNHMLDEIERLMHEVKGVCDDIAHDLRTPLTNLLAGLERAQRRGEMSQSEYQQAIEQAISQARGLLATFRALLRISEIEDNARRVGFARLDLNRIATDIAEFFEPMADEKQISLHWERSRSAVWITGDADLLFDAMCNLLDNALKFTPSGGAVWITLNAQPHYAVLSVSDNGPGVPEADREAVLRRFFRSERSRHTAGNGLGLSMVAAVARLHDVDVSLHDAQPGCQVRLRFTTEADPAVIGLKPVTESLPTAPIAAI
ncbi:signal transduction histidine kinase [Silvimonas terrae]|uniref:histidine kinase n=1 Tax=Silvimonas terrae TaxID=300266 RepID=A0A840RNP5_9NEIS|nr:ATP-binding protein [Silvimonas terrae]MBB5193681.1 signal transduction histidine kinase [Silvimonas terrae]